MTDPRKHKVLRIFEDSDDDYHYDGGDEKQDKYKDDMDAHKMT
jgi:hypothetical protein